VEAINSRLYNINKTSSAYENTAQGFSRDSDFIRFLEKVGKIIPLPKLKAK